MEAEYQPSCAHDALARRGAAARERWQSNGDALVDPRGGWTPGRRRAKSRRAPKAGRRRLSIPMSCLSLAGRGGLLWTTSAQLLAESGQRASGESFSPFLVSPGSPWPQAQAAPSCLAARQHRLSRCSRSQEPVRQGRSELASRGGTGRRRRVGGRVAPRAPRVQPPCLPT